MLFSRIEFPKFSGLRCLMMPFIQGEPSSLPTEYASYASIVERLAITKGDLGFLTIDESPVKKGTAHRGARAKFGRALHTEVGRYPGRDYGWGGGWGGSHRVFVDGDVSILLANSVTGSCALWDAVHEDVSIDGDIGDKAELYPYEKATFMRAGEVHKIGVLTPHESLPVDSAVNRQFLRIVSAGVHGREDYFTTNPLVSL